jgi:hypothetical protein
MIRYSNSLLLIPILTFLSPGLGKIGQDRGGQVSCSSCNPIHSLIDLRFLFIPGSYIFLSFTLHLHQGRTVLPGKKEERGRKEGAAGYLSDYLYGGVVLTV